MATIKASYYTIFEPKTKFGLGKLPLIDSEAEMPTRANRKDAERLSEAK